MSLKKVSVAEKVPSGIAEFLLESADYHEKNTFIGNDPICIPHRFHLPQDIEIIGFIVSCIAWGNRKSIIRSGELLCSLMDESPYDFIKNATHKEFRKLNTFVHRTFNGIDLNYFCNFLQYHYSNFPSLESAFNENLRISKATENADLEFNKTVLPSFHSEQPIEAALIGFREYFFSLQHPHRTEKHISSVMKNSACKRLNMFLRWMVRKNSTVDFGIWQSFNSKDLYLPLDVHVLRVANQLNLIEGDVANWQSCKDITALMRTILPNDPVKLDFALFGIGIEQKS